MLIKWCGRTLTWGCPKFFLSLFCQKKVWGTHGHLSYGSGMGFHFGSGMGFHFLGDLSTHIYIYDMYIYLTYMYIYIYTFYIHMSQAPPPHPNGPPLWPGPPPNGPPCGQGGGHYKQPCKHEPGHVIYDTPYSDEQACTQTYLDFCIDGEYIYIWIYI